MSVEVHHEIDGPADGEVVVLSNSVGSDLRMWDPQVKTLVDNGFRIIRYDTRGHGLSPVLSGPYGIDDLVDDVVALLDRVGAASAHFVGLSLGGMTGIRLGRRAPERVESLVLCCTSARPGNTRMWLDRATKARAEGMADIADGAVGRWFTPAWRAENPEVAREMREMAARTPAEGYAAACEMLADLDLTRDLPAITAPTLVISTADDQALPPAHGRLIADGVPGARFEVVGPGAHLGSFEQPEEFSRLIVEHLKGQAVK